MRTATSLGYMIAIGLLMVVYLWYRAWPDTLTHVIFCDVGQGDAILISAGQTQVLIDAGQYPDAVLTCLGEHMPPWDHQLELVVPTHADADHIGGFAAVAERYAISEVWWPVVWKETQVAAETLAGLASQSNTTINDLPIAKMPILGQQMRLSRENNRDFFGLSWLKTQLVLATLDYPREIITQTIQDDDSVITVLSPRVEWWESCQLASSTTQKELLDISAWYRHCRLNDQTANELSTGLLFRHGAFSTLLTADIEGEYEVAMTSHPLLESITVLKVGHHGSITSTTTNLLEKITPEIAVISVGQNNRYGHPHPTILQRLSQFDVEILRTDEQGTIEVVTDGQKWWIAETNHAF